MELSEAFEKTRAWVARGNALVDSLALESDERTRVSAALFHLSLEHHGSILALAEKQHFGSAFALARPQFESYVRGVWFQCCATKEQLQHFTADNNPPGIDQLIEAIEEQPAYSEKILSGLKARIWGALCGFTHGGYVQVSWRITPEEITSDFSEELLVSLLVTSCALSLQAYVAMAVLAKSEELATSVKEAHQEIFGYEEWHNKQPKPTP